jgi:hypothetical protein
VWILGDTLHYRKNCPFRADALGNTHAAFQVLLEFINDIIYSKIKGYVTIPQI